MQTKTGWIWLASLALLACNNPAPLADPSELAGASALDFHERACEVAEPSPAAAPEQTRGLYAAGEPASEGALTTYTNTCMSGSYAMQIDLDVFTQDDPVSTEDDPGRGRASLVLRADVAGSDVELRLCGLTLPPRYVYATSV